MTHAATAFAVSTEPTRWYFRNGALVPSNFTIGSVSSNGQSAVAVSPRGRRPRVYTEARLNELNRVRRERDTERANRIRDERNASTAAIAENPAFRINIAKARLIVENENRYSNEYVKRLAASVSRLLRNGDSRYGWNETNAGWLAEAVTRFECGAERVRNDNRDAAERRLNEANWLPIGRVDFRGEVLSVSHTRGAYGPVTKVLIRLENGSRVYGNWPNSGGNVAVGDRVKLRATVTRHASDVLFGYFSRPFGAEILGGIVDNE